MARHEELFSAIMRGRRKDAKKIVEAAVAEGADVNSLLFDTMIPAMRERGEQFSRGECFVPEMLISARAMQAGLDIIEPLMTADSGRVRHKIAIGTVKGDLHDIGKNLVAMMLKGAGYDVVDLGTDVDSQKFLSAAEEQGARAVFLSALLTTTMPYMKEVVKAFEAKPDVKIIVGGAPVTQDYANEIGAHGYGKDANEAVKVFESLMATA